MSKLDDLLGKKKTVVPVLDLSRSNIQSTEEFKRLMEKVPDYKMRPIKVRAEEIKIREKDYAFKMPKKEMRKLLKSNGERELLYTYADPVPGEMKDVVLMELCAVPIDWKMLTTLRPKSKQEEEYFSRMVEMGKLELKTEAKDRREFALNNCIKKIKNKSGIVETRLVTCESCGEEMCWGKSCGDFNYDLYIRVEAKVLKPKPLALSSNKTKLNGRKKSTIGGAKIKVKKSTNAK
ncbi:hypothetical protein KR215_007348 [Drosophila sulfurigaster]|uniref:Uncharacterized protein LOC117572566 n=1 Tax=Drosophila albomicans TaxID=7291 RepID=A0A6P8Z391_DROAB|nr:uncharacterized protein LOC117572566 [Drosophila albomicans]XP_060658066.1 uncharacterized protein LOC132792646 [Drosophila nasuta]KAH8391121.1 hypothetical protein KR215_007348 [Drosophila sulfurigaster]